jgi:hypothetical protein
MNLGYMVFIVIAPKGAEALGGQCFVADTEQGAVCLQTNLKSFRERHGMRRLEIENQGTWGGDTN